MSITVSGVLIPALALHHFHNITIEGNTSSKHSAVSSLQTNLLILSCPLKLLSSMAKVNTSKLKAMNKGNANKQHFFSHTCRNYARGHQVDSAPIRKNWLCPSALFWGTVPPTPCFSFDFTLTVRSTIGAPLSYMPLLYLHI